jgi:hypothetical protein
MPDSVFVPRPLIWLIHEDGAPQYARTFIEERRSAPARDGEPPYYRVRVGDFRVMQPDGTFADGGLYGDNAAQFPTAEAAYAAWRERYGAQLGGANALPAVSLTDQPH